MHGGGPSGMAVDQQVSSGDGRIVVKVVQRDEIPDSIGRLACVVELVGHEVERHLDGNADFVRTARSKGMSERRVVEWHVLRNALVLVVTIVGLQFGSLMGQAVVVEKLFAWPGVGSLMVDSVFQRDVPAVQGCILMIVLFFLAINTLVDIAYVVIDPRIRYR